MSLRYQEDFHYIILKGIIEGKITSERPQNTYGVYIYIGQIKCDARVNTFKELKEKPSNRSDKRIVAVNKLSGCKKKLLSIFEMWRHLMKS